MKEEYEMLCELLARIRGTFREEDFMDDKGFDRTGACAGSPVEMLAMIEIKINRLMKQVEQYKKGLQDIANSDGWLVEPAPLCTTEEAYNRCVKITSKSLRNKKHFS